MAFELDLNLTMIGSIIVIILVVIVIVWLWNLSTRRTRRRSSRWEHFEVETEAPEYEDRFKVARSHHHHSSSSSSNNCPAAPGGIGSTCTVNGDCAAGLGCVSGQCSILTCPGPDQVDPSSIRLTQGPVPNSINVSWSAVTGADVYQVTLRDTSTDFQRRILVDAPNTSTTFSDLPLGRSYFVEILTGSRLCGIPVFAIPSESGTFTLNCPTLPAFNASTRVQITNGPIVGNQVTVTITWDPATGANEYLYSLTEQGQIIPVAAGVTNVSTITIPNLTVGTIYNLVVYPGIENCGFNTTVQGTPIVNPLFTQFIAGQ